MTGCDLYCSAIAYLIVPNSPDLSIIPFLECMRRILQMACEVNRWALSHCLAISDANKGSLVCFKSLSGKYCLGLRLLTFALLHLWLENALNLSKSMVFLHN